MTKLLQGKMASVKAMSVSYEVYSDHTGADSKLIFFLEEVTFVSVAVEVTWVSCGGLVWWQLTYVSLERQTARCSNPTQAGRFRSKTKLESSA